MNKTMKNTVKTAAVAIAVAMCSVACFARPHGGPGFGGGRGGYYRGGGHHHHHHHSGWGRGGSHFWPGFVGGVVGGLITDAVVRPTTVVTAPTVVTTPTVIAPAPVVATPVYTTQNVWIEGRYVDQVQPNGVVVRVWQPGHYEQRQILVQ